MILLASLWSRPLDPFKSILVDVDATATAHPALDRAVRLARSLGATLTVTDVVTSPPAHHALPATIQEAMVRERREQLARVAQAVNGVRAEPKLLVGRPATVLIQEVLRSNHDLLMRSHARELAASGPRPFGAVDMELLRKCPCPVLLARDGSPASRPQIVAAVNASTEEADEQALNAKIVELALLMASHLEAASAQPVAGVDALCRTNGSQSLRTRPVRELRRRCATTRGCGSRASRAVVWGSPRRNAVHSAPRRARRCHPRFVVAERIDLVVMGTVARAGIAGMLIGNTAERVLRKLPCSVLTVKPDGFESPVRLDAPSR